jgi:hypothetical protein|tara:strand:- start:342 stop:470 length:129 start_codon:yes stop_codon:yes gene_type:complete
MDDKIPVAKENPITPKSSRNMQKTLSVGFVMDVSPYPTVVMV